MDIQVNKDQLERVVVKWLNRHFGNLTPKTEEKYGDLNLVLYVNSRNKDIMDYTINNKILHVDSEILGSLMDLFKIDQPNVRSIIRKWTYETYGINVDIVVGASY